MEEKPTPILIDLLVVVIDQAALSAFLKEQYAQGKLARDISLDTLSLPESVATALIVPFNGIRLEERSSERQSGEMVHIRQKVSVLNKVDVWRYARERIQSSFPGAVDDITLAEAVLEALVLSNPNPNPADMGLEIDTYQSWQR